MSYYDVMSFKTIAKRHTSELKYIYTDFFPPQTLNSQYHNSIKRMPMPNTGIHKLIFMSESIGKQ